MSPLSQVQRSVKVEGSKPLRSFIGRFPGGICGIMSSHTRGLTWHDIFRYIQVYLDISRYILGRDLARTKMPGPS